MIAPPISLPDTGLSHPPQIQEVAAGIYAYLQPDWTWMINNTGFLVGSEGVTVVDSCGTEPRTRAFLQAIRTVSDQPRRTLINTHHHGDHTYGNWLFPEATIIGHEKCRQAVIATGLNTQRLFPSANFGEVQIRPPFVTFAEGLTVYVDDLRLEVFHLGPAHTTNDSVVWIPEKKVLFAGDLVFKHCTPFVLEGAIASYFPALDRLRALGAETIVPGHGPVCGPEAFDEVAEYLRFVQKVARAGVAAGLSPLEAARTADLGPYAELADPERIVGNLYRAYSELHGDPVGSPLPLLPIVREMEAYNGHPVHCFA